MARKKQPQLKRVRSKITYEQLAKEEQKYGRTTKRLKAVHLADLCIADQCFNGDYQKKIGLRKTDTLANSFAS
jgi:hypothetical protein